MFTLDESQDLITWLVEICKGISPWRDQVRNLNVEMKRNGKKPKIGGIRIRNWVNMINLFK